MKLLVFAASHRKQSINRKLAGIAASIAQQKGASIEFPEYGDFDMPIYDDETFDSKTLPEAVKRFVGYLTQADGIIISSPEYNWSFPGSLKNIIDWTSVVTPNPFAGKTALLISASPSLRGGAQGLVQLKEPLQHLGVFVLPRMFTLACVGETFNEQGQFNDSKLMAELTLRVTEFTQATAVLSAQKLHG